MCCLRAGMVVLAFARSYRDIGFCNRFFCADRQGENRDGSRQCVQGGREAKTFESAQPLISNDYHDSIHPSKQVLLNHFGKRFRSR